MFSTIHSKSSSEPNALQRLLSHKVRFEYVSKKKFNYKPILTDRTSGAEDKCCHSMFTSSSPRFRGRCGEPPSHVEYNAGARGYNLCTASRKDSQIFNRPNQTSYSTPTQNILGESSQQSQPAGSKAVFPLPNTLKQGEWIEIPGQQQYTRSHVSNTLSLKGEVDRDILL